MSILPAAVSRIAYSVPQGELCNVLKYWKSYVSKRERQGEEVNVTEFAEIYGYSKYLH